jgi:hypothetical protein
MRVFIYQSQRDPGLFAFTNDRTGSNLPAELAPWRAFGGQAIASHRDFSGLGDSDAVTAALEADGYYIARTGERIAWRSDPS